MYNLLLVCVLIPKENTTIRDALKLFNNIFKGTFAKIKSLNIFNFAERGLSILASFAIRRRQYDKKFH